MLEPFKNFFNLQIITGMAEHFNKQWSDFDVKDFVNTAAENLEDLELKQRSEQITQAMAIYLPKDFSKGGNIIIESLSPVLEGDIFGVTVDDKGIAGWAIMPITHYVGLYGHAHFDLSMTILKECTKRFSSEFGIRFFLLKSPEKTLAIMKKWANDTDRHVRRLASEGSRPKLPWAMQLPDFINNPKPVIQLLEILKDDKEEYVRRSVANNLNDISKDHPELVADIAEKWMIGASNERIKLVKHGCRTLIKQGHKKTLATLGFISPKLRRLAVNISDTEITFGGTLQFALSITSDSNKDQPLMIDYIIHHQKKNGKTSPKVFKWRTTTLIAQKSITLTKNHAIKKITTRVYYAGLHTIEVVVNGVSVGKANFQLLIP